ncbi:MAG: hypothetical protein CVT64_06930 [Actinobacteria bacterium HGW-Actinobacteria-4]|nr:MAG: hypothetical protein CVT64_06930 [Actinobacteria bacterium HGW-Actinobacteria-4]
MKPYSDYMPRRIRQILCDVTAVLLIYMWVRIGNWVYTQVEKFTVFGERMEESGAGFRRTMTDLGNDFGSVPFIGDGIRTPFDAASRAGAELEAAGQAQQQAFTDLAIGLGIAVSAGPILTILVLWLVPRIRFAIRAHKAQALANRGAGVDLFALRALLNQKPEVLMRALPNPADAWRSQDRTALLVLADLELRSTGVRLSRKPKRDSSRPPRLP